MQSVYPGEKERLIGITAKVPREWSEGLDKTAKETGTIKSRLIRQAIWEYFNKHQIEV